MKPNAHHISRHHLTRQDVVHTYAYSFPSRANNLRFTGTNKMGGGQIYGGFSRPTHQFQGSFPPPPSTAAFLCRL